MSFMQAFDAQLLIDTATLPDNIVYGTGEGEKPPYYWYSKIADPETPLVLCTENNETGEALLQFTAIVENNKSTGNFFADAENMAEDLKDIVKEIDGTITDGTNDYNIISNICNGVQPFGGSEDRYYSALFECTIRWEKI